MTTVTITGRLICADAAQARILARELPAHVALSRAEPGCLRFDADPTDDPLIWTLHEQFRDMAAFEAHRARTAASGFGAAAAGIAREITVTDDAAP